MKVSRMAEGLVVELADEGETERLGRALAELITADTVIGLVGPLGAGKTRLTRAIAEALGVDSRAIASPTFVLHHVYEGEVLPVVHHFDAYRLRSVEEFEALGVAELFGEGGVSLVEWADRVAEVLPGATWWITLAVKAGGEGGERVATLRLPDAVCASLAAEL